MLTKICGIKKKETLICCESNNVDFFGMIFYPKSPRNILIEEAKILQDLSKTLNINGVAVFVDNDLINTINIIKELGLKFIQLHGNEDNKYIKSIKELDVNVIKKISIKNKSDLYKCGDYEDADYFLFDYMPDNSELPGGNSKSFDWNIIKNQKIHKPWFLSGGINSSNIKLIVSEINPFGVDLSSGVEKKLGIKDNEIINNFMSYINNA